MHNCNNTNSNNSNNSNIDIQQNKINNIDDYYNKDKYILQDIILENNIRLNKFKKLI